MNSFGFEFDDHQQVQVFLDAEGIKVPVSLDLAIEHKPEIVDEIITDAEARISKVSKSIADVKSDRSQRRSVPKNRLNVDKPTHEHLTELIDEVCKLQSGLNSVAELFGAGMSGKITFEDVSDLPQPRDY